MFPDKPVDKPFCMQALNTHNNTHACSTILQTYVFLKITGLVNIFETCHAYYKLTPKQNMGVARGRKQLCALLLEAQTGPFRIIEISPMSGITRNSQERDIHV